MQRRRPSRKRRAPRPPVMLETKWGWMPCVELGWCAVPSAFLRYAAPMGISPQESWLILQLLDLKWSEGRSPLDHLIERCGLDSEGVHSRLRSLEERGFLKLIPKYQNSLVANGSSSARPPLSKPLTGWEIDLSPLLQALNDCVMRGGELDAGFLRLSSVRIEKQP